MIASKPRITSFSGILCFFVGSPPSPVHFNLLFLLFLPILSVGQGNETKSSPLKPDDFAEIYVDRYFEPDEELKLTSDSRNKAAALAHFSIGRMLENDGQPDAAIKSYEKVIELQPGEIMLARKTANLLARTGQADKARTLLEKTLKANPDKARAHIVLSEFLYGYFSDNQDDRERSLKLATDAISKFPNDPDVYENLVRRYLIEGKREEAKKVMNLATQQDNWDPHFWLRLGELAKRTWPTRTSDSKEPVLVNGIYEKALSCAGKDVRIIEKVGDYYRKSNQQQKAQKLYEAIIAKTPERLDVRRKLVTVFFAQSKQEEAIEALKGIVEINSRDANAHQHLARIYYSRFQEQIKKADNDASLVDNPDLLLAGNHFKYALRASRGSANDYIQTGRIFRWAEKTDESVEILEEGAYLFPENPAFPEALANTYRAVDQWEEVVVQMKKIIKLATQAQPEMLDDNFYFQYGIAYERAGDIKAATVQLRKSIEIINNRDPNDPRSDDYIANVYNYLGYTWVENDMNIDEGGELIKSALELDPNSGAITDSLGWFYFKKKKFEDARKTLLKAQGMINAERDALIAEGRVLSDPDGVIFDHIAQAHWMTGYKEKAIKFMEKAIALEKENKAEFEKRLKEYQNGEPPVPKPVGKKETDTPPEEKPSQKPVGEAVKKAA